MHLISGASACSTQLYQYVYYVACIIYSFLYTSNIAYVTIVYNYILVYTLGNICPLFHPCCHQANLRLHGQIPVSNYLLINNTTLVEHTQDKAKPFANEECVKYMGQK